MDDFVDCFDKDNHYSVELDDQIWSFLIERDSIDLSSDVDSSLRDVFGFGSLGLDAILTQPLNAVPNAMTANTPNFFASPSIIEAHALRLLDHSK